MTNKKNSLSQKLKSSFKSSDGIAPSIQTQLHIEDNEVQKTYAGATFTWMIRSLLAYFVITQGQLMFDKQ